MDTPQKNVTGILPAQQRLNLITPPHRQPPTSHVELTPQASQAAGAYRPVPASRPQTLTQYGGDLSQAAPGGGGTQWDTSTERRIRHDQQALHATQIQPGDSVASFGDGYVPAPPVSHHSGGWSYSEGDDVHIPETRLPRDAGHSAVTSPEFTMPAYVNGSPMYRPGVQARYPVWGTQPSAATSVAQPSYPQHQGHTAVGVAPVNGGVGYQVASPGPEGVEQQQGGGQLYGTPSRVNALLHAAGVPPGSSAAHVKLTPEQRQQVERKRKQALEKRQAMHEKRARVARELFVGGQSGGPLGVAPNSPGGAGAGGGSNWQTPAALQHHSAPEATHSTSPAGRAEANRLLALQRRACRLEQQVADLLQKEATVGKAACLQLRRQLEDDVRKYVIAARQLPQGAVPSPGSSQGSGDVASQGSDLTPAQRERAEANRQAALLRQQQRVEQSVGAFIARAEGKARLAEAGGSGEGGAPDQMGHAFI